MNDGLVVEIYMISLPFIRSFAFSTISNFFLQTGCPDPDEIAYDLDCMAMYEKEPEDQMAVLKELFKNDPSFDDLITGILKEIEECLATSAAKKAKE